jgi:hypothetical protein
VDEKRCGKCGRPSFAPNDQAGFAFTSIEACFWQDGAMCMAHACGFRAGLVAGVELAKANLRVGPPNEPPPGGVVGWRASDVKPRWERVDAELARRTK